MQLLDRYLTAIKFWLPSRQREDIAAELAANLQSEIDDRSAELDRALSDDEIAALLKQHGSPILVASRYQQEHRTVTIGRQLIGPIVFPFYWTAIKVTLVLLLIPGIVPAVVLGTLTHGRPFSQFGHALTRVAWLSLPALLIVTLVFAEWRTSDCTRLNPNVAAVASQSVRWAHFGRIFTSAGVNC